MMSEEDMILDEQTEQDSVDEVLINEEQTEQDSSSSLDDILAGVNELLEHPQSRFQLQTSFSYLPIELYHGRGASRAIQH